MLWSWLAGSHCSLRLPGDTVSHAHWPLSGICQENTQFVYHKSSLLSGTGSGDLRVISLTNSFHISNLVEILYWFHWDYDRVIITKCWTCKHSSAVIACAKICISLMTRNIITEPFFCIKFLTGVKNYLWNGDLFKLGLAQVSHVFHLKLLSEMKLKSYNHQLSWGQMGLWHITLKQGWRQCCEVILGNPMHAELVSGNRDIDGLVQERRNSSALAMELRLSCTNTSIYIWFFLCIPPHWNVRLLRLTSKKDTQTFPFEVVNIMAADDLATSGASTSEATILISTLPSDD